MSKGEDGWYTASAPVWVNSIIVNGNSGDVQTEDISIDAAEVWVTVSEDGTSDLLTMIRMLPLQKILLFM